MVTGWEQYTHELTEFEKEHILQKVIDRWRKKDVDQMVTMKEMIQAINTHSAKMNWIHKGKIYKISGPRMRKIIHVIRVSGVIPNLIANSKGYFKTDDPTKIRNFVKSCRERSSSFKEVADAIETYNFER